MLQLIYGASILVFLLIYKIEPYHWEEEMSSFSNLLPQELCTVSQVHSKANALSHHSCHNETNDDFISKQLQSRNFNRMNYELFTMCQLGVGHAGQQTLRLRHAQKLSKSGNNPCIVRLLQQRHGLRYSWTASNNNSAAVFTTLFQVLKNRNISNISFLGDSISMQVAKMFGCDLFRSSFINVVNGEPLLVSVPPSNTKQYATFEMNGQYLSINSSRLFTPCIEYTLPECNTSESIQLFYYNHIKFELENMIQITTTSSSSKIIIFNVGLHFRLQNANNFIPAAAKALLDVAKQNHKKNFILFRETSSQHFNGHSGGYYDGNITSSSTSTSTSHRSSIRLCCDRSIETKAIEEGNWRNTYFRSSLDLLDKEWYRYIGWLPFFSVTLPLHDLHDELNPYNSRGQVDCSHFIYKPFLFYPLWESISDAIIKLEKFI